MAERFFSRNFVWYSDRQSIAAGKVSVLACAEVVLVAAYWWIAWYFDTYTHLLVSIVVAPLVLLRSDRSVALGVEMFLPYVEDLTDIRLRSFKGLAIAGGCGLLAFGGSWLVAKWALPGHEGWALFWRSAAIGLVAVSAMTAPAVAVMGIEAGKSAAPAAGAGVGLPVGATVAGAGAGAVAVAIAVAGLVVGVAAGSAVGMGLGVLIRALIARVFATCAT